MQYEQPVNGESTSTFSDTRQSPSSKCYMHKMASTTRVSKGNSSSATLWNLITRSSLDLQQTGSRLHPSLDTKFDIVTRNRSTVVYGHMTIDNASGKPIVLVSITFRPVLGMQYSRPTHVWQSRKRHVLVLMMDNGNNKLWRMKQTVFILQLISLRRNAYKAFANH